MVTATTTGVGAEKAACGAASVHSKTTAAKQTFDRRE